MEKLTEIEAQSYSFSSSEDDNKKSDHGSEIEVTSPWNEDFSCYGLSDVQESSLEWEMIKQSFLNGMGHMRNVANVLAVRKIMSSFIYGKQARVDSFQIFSKAVAEKCGGNPNLRYAWYGSSLAELLEVVYFGFCSCRSNIAVGESHGAGICMSHSAIDGALSTVADEQGLRHVLLCKVLLGRVETVPAGSTQRRPSSKQFDSGVDNVLEPRKYIIWSAFMNSHILPEYLLSFNYTSNGPRLPRRLTIKPRSKWLKFSTLMASLSGFLDPYKMAILVKSHGDYQEGKITRREWIKQMRETAGDRLLKLLLKKHGEQVQLHNPIL